MLKIKGIKKIIPAYLLTISVVASCIFPLTVLADEIVISGNSAGSENSITVNTSIATSVEQTNTAMVENAVAIETNTGGNTIADTTASQNSIETGNIDVNVAIENAANTAVAETVCCTENLLSLEISENGQESQNGIILNSNQAEDIIIAQNASVSNQVEGTANTGGNSINDSGGSASISTGDIRVRGEVDNGPINQARVVASSSHNADNVSIWISNNNTSSINTLLLDFEDNTAVSVSNSARVLNDVIWNLATGNNAIEGNLGNASISTGGIDFVFFVHNGPINSSFVDLDCCVLEDPNNSDPQDPGEDEDDNKPLDEQLDNNDDPDTSNDDSQQSDNSGVGGFILGLSNTSSKEANSLIFFAGLILIGIGGKIVSLRSFDKKPR